MLSFIKLITCVGLSVALCSCFSYDLRRDLEKSSAASRKSSFEYQMQKENLDRVESQGVKIRGAAIEYNSEQKVKTANAGSHFGELHRVIVGCRLNEFDKLIPIKHKEIFWSVMQDEKALKSGKSYTDESGVFPIDLGGFKGLQMHLSLGGNLEKVEISDKLEISITSFCKQ